MPLEVYVATDKDSFRKPMTDAWDFMLEMNELKEVDKLSFYCGDAAGRAKGYIKGRNKDFNITDRYFASNIGIQFYTPEEIFLGMKPFPYIDDYLEHDDYLMKKAWPLPASLNDKEKNVIIMIGPQASGKSTLSKTLFEEYTYLNNDEIKSMPKLKRLYEASLKKKENVVVDNTNPTIEVRSYFINLAEEYGYKIYAYFFDFTKPLTMHMNQYRVQSTHGERRAIPDVAIHTYYKKLEEPSLDEGYTSLIRLKKVYNLKPDKTFARYYYYKYDV